MIPSPVIVSHEVLAERPSRLLRGFNSRSGLTVLQPGVPPLLWVLQASLHDISYPSPQEGWLCAFL